MNIKWSANGEDGLHEKSSWPKVIIIIPEQFTVKAQRPLLGVKKRGGRRRRRRKNLFVGKSYELSRTVFKSEIGQQIFFWQKV